MEEEDEGWKTNFFAKPYELNVILLSKQLIYICEYEKKSMMHEKIKVSKKHIELCKRRR